MCIFCDIINGKIPSATIFENSEFKVIMDAFPASKGHTLVICKEHIENIFAIDSDTAARMFALVTHIARALKQELDFDGLNILQNNGAEAGQTVPHFHIHLIPRYASDGLDNFFEPKKQADFEEILAIAEKIKALV